MTINIENFNINKIFKFTSADDWHENGFLLAPENKQDFIKWLKRHFSNENYEHIDNQDVSDFFVQNANNTIFIFDVYKDNQNYTYIFTGKDSNIDSLSKQDREIVDKILSNNNSQNKDNKFSFAFVSIQKNYFNAFIDWFYWYSPIEYYIQWKIEQENNLEKNYDTISPYKYITEQINKEISKDWYEAYITHKEKYWRWVYEGIRIDNINRPLDLLKVNEGLFYTIYYIFEKSKIDYERKLIFVQYDYYDEWKNDFWIDTI